MKINSRIVLLTAVATLGLGALSALHAQDNQPRRDGGRGGFGFGLPMRGPAFDSLSQDEKDKLKAAAEKAQQDPKVKEAREKLEAAMKDLREAVQAAIVAADPSVEPIVKKLQEAREKAQAEGGGRRPGGDQPNK